MDPNLAPSFADLLAADSDFVMPTTDKEVQAALDSFGAIFKKTRGDANVAVRAELLAGLALLHTHHLDLAPLLAALSPPQQLCLATALDLDFPSLGADPTWPTLVARRIVAKQAPGLTPKKRRPAAADAPEGQIQKPGGAPPPPPQPAPGADRQKRKKKAAAAGGAQIPSSAESSADGSGSDVEVLQPPPAPVGPIAPGDLMPAELGCGPAFDALVAAGCARRWLGTDLMEQSIPVGYRSRLFCGRLWASKARIEYDKMITRQSSKRPITSRREDPRNVAFPHRLTFAFALDDGLELDAEHLRLVSEGERISDWAGLAGRVIGGNTGRAAYKATLDELATAWEAVSTAARRLEHVGAPAIQNLIDLFVVLLERRYVRFAAVLPAGRPREEILANVARQLGELRSYFADFNRVLADCASRMPYGEQARFAGTRYLTLFTPAMRQILESDCGRPSAGAPPPLLGEGGGHGPPAPPPPPAKSPRGILRPTTPAVSFADTYIPVHHAFTPAPTVMELPPSPTYWPPPPAYVAPFSPGPARVVASPASLGAFAWGGQCGPSGCPTPVPVGGSPFQIPPTTPASYTPVKAEPGTTRPKKDKDKEKFLSQPMHVYVTGRDCASAPEGETWTPPCGCGNHSNAPGYAPGPHATWDCPLRYIARCGYCPGFINNGMRDPAQWQDASQLTRAAKDKWVELIGAYNLPLPRERLARPPPFHL